MAVRGCASVVGRLVFRRGLLFVSVALSPRSFGCLSTSEVSVFVWEVLSVPLVYLQSIWGASVPVAL